MLISDAPVTLQAFQAAVASDCRIEIAPEIIEKLTAARAVVDVAANGDAPVYGLNTGLGANLGHRIARTGIPAFQRQLIEGRAVAVGQPLPSLTGRAVILARLVSARGGASGISLPVFNHLVAAFNARLSPDVPEFGSIGAGDLTQNAVWALGVLDSEKAAPNLQPKDAMALINHSGLSVALAAVALTQAQQGLAMLRAAALLSVVGYGVNFAIFSPNINALRASPGQAETAQWFADRLTKSPPRRIQDAISFRTLAPVMGAAQAALDRAIAVWEAEANGASDSPAVLGDEAMQSTPNFHAPALALALEGVSLALAMVANGAVQRMQRMMNPDLTGLPRYLSPVGGASAGMVPLQKTAAALLSDIRRHAMPVVLDAAPVSDGVEDMAAMTPQAARKLSDQMRGFHLLASAEALVAAQAVDLRAGPISPAATQVMRAVRSASAKLEQDRPLGKEIDAVADALRDVAELI